MRTCRVGRTASQLSGPRDPSLPTNYALGLQTGHLPAAFKGLGWSFIGKGMREGDWMHDLFAASRGLGYGTVGGADTTRVPRLDPLYIMRCDWEKISESDAQVLYERKLCSG